MSLPTNPVTRIEQYLARKATGEGDVPSPANKKEEFLYNWATGEGSLPSPVSANLREERILKYLCKICGGDCVVDTPVYGLEYFLARLANGEGDVPDPVTRVQEYLKYIIDNEEPPVPPVSTAGVTFDDDQFYTWEELLDYDLMNEYGYAWYRETGHGFDVGDCSVYLAECYRVKIVEMEQSGQEIRGDFLYGSSIVKAVLYGDCTDSGMAFGDCTNLTELHLNDPVEMPMKFASGCTALTDIYFNGTMLEWEDLPKYESARNRWDRNTGEYIVHCTDGDVPKGG